MNLNFTPFLISPRGEMMATHLPPGEVPIAIGREGGKHTEKKYTLPSPDD